METLPLILLGIVFLIGLIIAWKYQYSLGDTFALLSALFLTVIVISVFMVGLDKNPEVDKVIIVVGLLSFAYIVLWTFYTLAKKY